jgi:hypothetical protein|eukprot:COSAG01_NODE_1089_length_11778_cov_17.582242_5_plen_134_part_00
MVSIGTTVPTQQQPSPTVSQDGLRWMPKSEVCYNVSVAALNASKPQMHSTKSLEITNGMTSRCAARPLLQVSRLPIDRATTAAAAVSGTSLSLRRRPGPHRGVNLAIVSANNSRNAHRDWWTLVRWVGPRVGA